MAKRSRTTISNVTSKGTFSPGTTGSGKLAQIGTVIDGVLYRRPRLGLDRLSGRKVRITNPRETAASAQGRTASMGMGAVGQTGRVRDVGASADS